MTRIFTLILLALLCNSAYSQTTENYAIEVMATPSTSPPKITLQWKPVGFGTYTYSIWRKAKSATSWGTALATGLPPTDSVYVDSLVIVDSAYEYQIEALGTTISSFGYVYAGIKCPAIHNRGIVLMLVDSTYIDSCATGLKKMMDDLSGDGWQVIRHDFLRTKTDVDIKAVISSDYSSHANVKAVLIVGHLAVPYSADFNSTWNPPDGHVPQHDGAWPADVFYSCLTGSWTDFSANDVTGSYSANWNVPGDGKWDQNMIPSPALLQVSRIDVYNMPAFSPSEYQLMNSYLLRDHTYKMDSLGINHRGIITDNFPEPFSGEAFAANGWRNFPQLVGRDSITYTASALISTMAAGSYQWAYGCGPGSFTSAGGIGATSNIAANPNNGIFMMLFGSYFGDWNVQDNFLRAPLCATNPALTNCWAGRPNWFFHHMALGDNIGYDASLTQNNTGILYQPTGFGNGWIHPALMGDLSLRTDYIKPISNLTVAAPWHNGGILNWTASPDPGVIGYYIYRADSAYGYFQRLNATMVTATTYHDLTGTDGLKYYMVRPVKLQSTPSGGYYNLGLGVTDTATVTFAPTAVAATQSAVDVSLFPNPAQGFLNVTVNTTNPCQATMYVVNLSGQYFNLCTKQLNTGNNYYTLNTASLDAGVYMLVVNTGSGQVVKKWTKL